MGHHAVPTPGTAGPSTSRGNGRAHRIVTTSRVLQLERASPPDRESTATNEGGGSCETDPKWQRGAAIRRQQHQCRPWKGDGRLTLRFQSGTRQRKHRHQPGQGKHYRYPCQAKHRKRRQRPEWGKRHRQRTAQRSTVRELTPAKPTTQAARTSYHRRKPQCRKSRIGTNIRTQYLPRQ